MKLLLVVLFCMAGCITDPDLRPPLMDDSDFSDFLAPSYYTTNCISTNCIVSD